MNLSQLLQLHAPHLSPGLVPQSSMDRLLSLSQLLPHAFSPSELYLEYVLHENTDFLDMSFKINKDFLPLPSTLTQKELWKTLNNFLKAQKELLDQIIVECDFHHQGSWPPDPSIHFSINTLSEQLVHSVTRFFTPEHLLPSEVLTNVRFCIETMRAFQQHLFSLSFMLARSRKSVRLYSFSDNVSDTALIRDYLSRIGYPYQVDLLSFLEEIRPFLLRIGVQIDVGEKIGDKIAIECCPRRRSFAILREDIEQILHTMRAHSLFSLKQDKMDHLLNWFGGTKTITLTQEKKWIARTINHVKLVFARGVLKEVKLYLLVKTSVPS